MSAPDTLAILRREVGEAKLDAAVVDALERVIPRWESRLDSEASLAGFRADEIEEEKAA
jgi:hypothetical protein